ncbi:MAG: DUF599 domain-containing protein, partial [Limnobacter sp.]|nr:DUF599 domain-containing protein [Limnobacter sp.]
MNPLDAIVQQLSPLDWLALLVFLVCWKVYGFVVDGSTRISAKGLVSRTHRYRELWARELINRSNRVSDTALLGNLIHSVSFYANTTIYIMAGLLAVLGTLEQVMAVTSDLAFSKGMTKAEMELKLLLVLGVFIVAYFKFTWSLRQFNLLSILVGAAPESTAKADYIESYIRRMAKVNSLAGDEFNRGIRAYYFAIASTAWMLH